MARTSQDIRLRNRTRRHCGCVVSGRAGLGHFLVYDAVEFLLDVQMVVAVEHGRHADSDEQLVDGRGPAGTVLRKPSLPSGFLPPHS